MKTTFLSAIFLLLLGNNAVAYEPISFLWTCNSDAGLAGYKIYWSSMAGEPYEHSLDVGMASVDGDGNCTYTLADPPAKLNYYAATAYDDDGFESSFSNEVDARTKMTPPGQLREK